MDTIVNTIVNTPTPKTRGKRGPAPGKGAKIKRLSNQQFTAKILASEGFTFAEIAEKLHLCKDTVERWANKLPGLKAARQKGRERLTDRIEDALSRRAVGMTIPDSAVTNYKGEVTVTPLKKHLAPDVLAQIFALKNLRPDKWRDRQEVSSTVMVAGLPDDVLRRAQEIARARDIPVEVVEQKALSAPPKVS